MPRVLASLALLSACAAPPGGGQVVVIDQPLDTGGAPFVPVDVDVDVDPLLDHLDALYAIALENDGNRTDCKTSS